MKTEASPGGPVERIVRVQHWLAELNRYGGAKLVDGPHNSRDGVEKSATLLRRLGLAGDRVFAAAEVHLTDLTGEHSPVDERAVGTLNAIGLRPNAALSCAGSEATGNTKG